jgi:transposase
MICDFWGAYNKVCALAKQRCFFHLFTELVKVDKVNRSAPWKAFRKTLTRLLKDAVRLSEQKSQKDPLVVARLRQRLQTRLAQLLETVTQDSDVRRLLKRLKRHEKELLTFLDYENVSPYNNHAEQQMRKPVLTRKVSQQNRSEQGAKTQAILMTLFRSTELQGENPFEAVLSLAKSFILNKPNQDGALKLVA